MAEMSVIHCTMYIYARDLFTNYQSVTVYCCTVSSILSVSCPDLSEHRNILTIDRDTGNVTVIRKLVRRGTSEHCQDYVHYHCIVDHTVLGPSTGVGAHSLGILYWCRGPQSWDPLLV